MLVGWGSVPTFYSVGISDSFSGSKVAGTWNWPLNAYLVPRLRMGSALCALHGVNRDSFTFAPWKIQNIDGAKIFDFVFGFCMCPFGGFFGQNNTRLLLAAAHLVLFFASHFLTPDGGQTKSAWRSITSYNFGPSGRLAPVSPTRNSANTVLVIA